MITPFTYHQPATLDEAAALLARFGAEARLHAGGSALLVDIQRGDSAPAHLIGLDRIPSLADIHDNDGIHIGAMVTLTDLVRFARSHPALAALVEAAESLGGKQIQNVATVGGNLCYASPGADMVPALLCLDARLRLVSPAGERVIPLDGFITAPNQTALRPAEILVEIVLPISPPFTGTTALKMMRRRARDLSLAAAAARITLTADGARCADARIALCAAAPTPIRCRSAESALTGVPLTPELIRLAARAAASETQPVTDHRASAAYRRMLAETLVERAVMRAWERAASGEREPS
jgi:carbon-monoxide dehydrogenase medium subunit